MNQTNIHSVISLIPVESRMIDKFRNESMNQTTTLKRNPFAYIGARMASLHAITYLQVNKNNNAKSFDMVGTAWLFAIALIAIAGSALFMCLKHRKVENEVDEEKAPVISYQTLQSANAG